MNAFALLPDQPWVPRLGWTLLHFLWQGAAIAALFSAVRYLLAGSLTARARYGLGCTALAAMVAAPAVTFRMLGPSALPAVAREAIRPMPIAFSGTFWLIAPAGVSRDILPWIVLAWLCGAAAFSARLTAGWLLAARIRFTANRPAPQDWQASVDRLRARVGIPRPVRVLVSSLVHAPMVTGWLRPAILAPIGALSGLPPEQMEAILAHELAHVWRNDYLANLLQSVAEALLFYHPAVWWLSRQIRAERELCCDDVAVALSGNALMYARALAGMESLRAAGMRAAVAANGGCLRDRIRRILYPAHPSSASRPTLGAALLLTVLLLGAIGYAALQEPAAPLPVQYAIAVRAAPVAATKTIAAATTTQGYYFVRNEPSPGERRDPDAAAFERRVFLLRENRNDSFAGKTVAAIEIRGLSEASARELVASLPFREGDPLPERAGSSIERAARPFSSHMEFAFAPLGDDGVVVRIHPAGSANAPLVPRR